MTSDLKTSTSDFSFTNVYSHLDDDQSQCEKILLRGEPLVVGQYGHTIYPVLFPSSLVMLSPRWTNESYHKFYSSGYDDLYRLDSKPDVGIKGIERNAREIIDRLKKFDVKLLKSACHILDAGAGPGYGLTEFSSNFGESSFYAIEGSLSARKILETNNFAKLIGSFVDTNLSEQYENFFDLIVLRHVVEHFLDPVQDLSNIARMCKKTTGLVYIAVPDMLSPRILLRDYENWWEYWFRAVHTYYYNRYTLFETMRQAKLQVVAFGEENEEIWCLARKEAKPTLPFVYTKHDAFRQQKEVFRKYLP